MKPSCGNRSCDFVDEIFTWQTKPKCRNHPTFKYNGLPNIWGHVFNFVMNK